MMISFNSPSLTWRDVQYITLLTSNPEPMEDGNWISNGKNRKGQSNLGLNDFDPMEKEFVRLISLICL